jgi:hypothetical protein
LQASGSGGDVLIAPASEAERASAVLIPSTTAKGKALEPVHRFQTLYHSHRCRREQGETSQYGWMADLIA